MKKDAYYFPHFCNARHDRKLKRLQKDLGLEGYGIFFMLLEILREQSDFRFPYPDLDLLADEFGTSIAKVEIVINLYDLFEVDEDKSFFSPKLIFYLQPYLEKSDRARRANEIRWGKAKELPDVENKENLVKPDKKDKTTSIDFKSIIESYINKQEIQEAIYQYIEHRKAMKKPIKTEYTLKLILKELSKYKGNEIEVINQSIANGWQGLFELKVSKPSNKPQNQSSNIFHEIGKEEGLW